MGPKKKAKEPEGGLLAVEKAFLENEIAQANNKVVRLRTAVDDLEKRNEELQKAYDKLDEDRADIIAYLKRTLKTKTEENKELKEKVEGLEEIRQIETAQFQKTIADIEKKSIFIKDKLVSENKLLSSKLNALEEFRLIRDDLMKKFEIQEENFKDQEIKYKRIIYDAEKKFVISKDKLKKEMEARLLQLAQDFQDVTELRIAASTHRVIRENIAINNELEAIVASQSKLSELTEKYKEREKNARISQELAEEERDKAINNSIIQLKVINKLTSTFEDVKKEKALYLKKSFDIDSLHTKVEMLTKENDKLNLKVRILEQNLHLRIADQNKSTVETSLVLKESEKLKRILKDATTAIKAALKIDEWFLKDPTQNITPIDRTTLLTQLLEIITQYHEMHKADSTETLISLGGIYKAGDLGFIPKEPKKQIKLPVVRKSQSLRPKVSQDRSTTIEKSSNASVRSPSCSSLKTIPSMRIVTSIKKQMSVESIPSFVTSTKSTTSSSSDKEEEVEIDVQKQLEASKMEIQKSILKDLMDAKQSVTSLKTVHSEKSLKPIFIKEDDEAERAFKDEPTQDKNVGDQATKEESEKYELTIDENIEDQATKEVPEKDEPINVKSDEDEVTKDVLEKE